ncbi:ectonucleotide pyrophosphatase/phosphodiesterase [Phenylobacterium sp. J367]|nr:ectonucleotide pyrophosphatase/phosphodiesterase [Phenylobacterium sp. J367]MCR5880748.1 ectonucleotide pyrophosphatase/phosphodiesterase [Phenylobacterium sp. J367]
MTPELDRLAAAGASATMRPSFPVKTFPNHYALVTGLRPDRNGIVENNMLDPEIPGVEFKLSNREAVSDRRWWDDGIPVWVSAERAGLRSATMFWPGSEAPIRGVRPSLWLPFDQKLPSADRVDQLLSWLDATPAAPPAFLTLYFDEVDTAGHYARPGSEELGAAIRGADAGVARLTAGLKARGIAANLVIVSDHGMAPMSAERRIYLEDLLPPDGGRALAMGPILTYYPAKGREAEVERALLAPHERFRCWRKAQIPRPGITVGIAAWRRSSACPTTAGRSPRATGWRGRSGRRWGPTDSCPHRRTWPLCSSPRVLRFAPAPGSRPSTTSRSIRCSCV